MVGIHNYPKCTLSEIIDPTKVKTEKKKSIWEKEASFNTKALCLVNLLADHSKVPKQEPVTTTMADFQERVSVMKNNKDNIRPRDDIHLLPNEWLLAETGGTHPELLTQGQTLQIMRGPEKEKIAPSSI